MFSSSGGLLAYEVCRSSRPREGKLYLASCECVSHSVMPACMMRRCFSRDVEESRHPCRLSSSSSPSRSSCALCSCLVRELPTQCFESWLPHPSYIWCPSRPRVSHQVLRRHIRATLCVPVSPASPSRSASFMSRTGIRDCVAGRLHFYIPEALSSSACLGITRGCTSTWAQRCPHCGTVPDGQASECAGPRVLRHFIPVQPAAVHHGVNDDLLSGLCRPRRRQMRLPV